MFKAFTDNLRDDLNEAFSKSKDSVNSDQMRAAINRALKRCNLVTREEFDAQARVLVTLEGRLLAMEQRLVELERRGKQSGGSGFDVKL